MRGRSLDVLGRGSYRRVEPYRWVPREGEGGRFSSLLSSLVMGTNKGFVRQASVEHDHLAQESLFASLDPSIAKLQSIGCMQIMAGSQGRARRMRS